MAVRAEAVRAALGMMAVFLSAYIVVPPLYWNLMEAFVPTSCPPCNCNCDPQFLTIPEGLSNGSVTDCAKQNNPNENKDTQKKLAELLSEELKQRTEVALENQYRANKALLEAKKMTSQFQKEADKCNSGMETCEGAREKSHANLLAQKQLTSIWEQRARQKGWNGGNARLRSQFQITNALDK